MGVWSWEEKERYIIILEMKTVQLALNAFFPRILGESVILINDNVTVVAHLKKQEGTVPRVMCCLTQEIITRTELHSVTLSSRYILGQNILPDQVFPTKSPLLPLMFDTVCKVCSHPRMDLLAIRANMKLPLYVSPVLDPMTWKQDPFQYPWNDISAYAFTPSLM